MCVCVCLCACVCCSFLLLLSLFIFHLFFLFCLREDFQVALGKMNWGIHFEFAEPFNQLRPVYKVKRKKIKKIIKNLGDQHQVFETLRSIASCARERDREQMCLSICICMCMSVCVCVFVRVCARVCENLYLNICTVHICKCPLATCFWNRVFFLQRTIGTLALSKHGNLSRHTLLNSTPAHWKPGGGTV